MATKPKYRLGDIVWHRADNTRGVIFAYDISENDTAYRVSFGPVGSSTCYACELTNVRPIDGVDNSETEEAD